MNIHSFIGDCLFWWTNDGADILSLGSDILWTLELTPVTIFIAGLTRLDWLANDVAWIGVASWMIWPPGGRLDGQPDFGNIVAFLK